MRTFRWIGRACCRLRSCVLASSRPSLTNPRRRQEEGRPSPVTLASLFLPPPPAPILSLRRSLHPLVSPPSRQSRSRTGPVSHCTSRQSHVLRWTLVVPCSVPCFFRSVVVHVRGTTLASGTQLRRGKLTQNCAAADEGKARSHDAESRTVSLVGSLFEKSRVRAVVSSCKVPSEAFRRHVLSS